MATYGVRDWRKLGAVLRDARRRQGLTQADLAEQAGVSRAWLAKLEAGGHRRAEMEQIFRLLSALSLEMVVREQRHSAGESAVLAALGRTGQPAVSSSDAEPERARDMVHSASAPTSTSTSGSVTVSRAASLAARAKLSQEREADAAARTATGQARVHRSQRAQIAATRRAAADRAAADRVRATDAQQRQRAQRAGEDSP